jgi:hypothetical protein
MNVDRICLVGYFDRVLIDGYAMPMYNTKGIAIESNETLVDAINTNTQSYAQGIGKVRITIYGEADFNPEDDQLLGMRWHREQELKLTRTKIGNADRYAIAYVDLLILKSNYSFPEEVKNRGKTSNDISKLAKSEDEYMLLTKALEIQKSTLMKKDNNENDANIAIVDRLYVNKEFRQCGISSWIHSNIGDIIKTFGMIDIASVILIPGDFSNEAQSQFGVSKDKYRDFLIKHYKEQGYKFVDKHIMCKTIAKTKKTSFIGGKKAK